MVCRAQPFDVKWTAAKCPGCKFTHILWDLQFVDESHAWGIGSRMPHSAPEFVVVHSEDGGRIWRERRETYQYAYAPTVFFLDQQRGWMAYANVTLISTSVVSTPDGGKTWSLAANEWLRSMHLFDGLHGLASRNEVDGYGQMIFTRDGGKHWIASNAPRLRWGTVVWTGNGRAILRGEHDGRAVLLKTQDAGEKWAETALPEKPKFLSFFDADHGWLIAKQEGAFASYRTTDGGVTWSRGGDVHAQESIGVQDSMFALSANIALISVRSGPTHYFYTLDGGAQWTKFSMAYEINACQLFQGSLRCAASLNGKMGIVTLSRRQ